MIRPYHLADVDQVLVVWDRASAEAHPFLSAAFRQQERIAIRDVYLATAETWVWEDGGAVVAFVSLLGNEIGGLFVDPAHQRSGIGHALVAHCRRFKGTLTVEVFARNEDARAFYEHEGFRESERRIHEPTGLEMMRMRLG